MASAAEFNPGAPAAGGPARRHYRTGAAAAPSSGRPAHKYVYLFRRGHVYHPLAPTRRDGHGLHPHRVADHPGHRFIGAGSILHAKTSVTGLTTAATIFVAAGVGMAAGGGLYLTAVFATGIILIALEQIGRA